MGVKDLAPKNLEEARKRGVQLRLSGHSLAEIAALTGLSVPTITKVFKAFEAGGWAAIKPAPRGRKAGEGSGLTAEQQQQLGQRLLAPPASGLWSREAVVAEVKSLLGVNISERAAARLLDGWGLNTPAFKVIKPKGVRNPAARWYRQQYQPLLDWVEKVGAEMLMADCHPARRNPDSFQLCLHTPLRKQLWLETLDWPVESWLIEVFERALQMQVQPLAICLSGLDLSRAEQLHRWLSDHQDALHLVAVPAEVELRSS